MNFATRHPRPLIASLLLAMLASTLVVTLLLWLVYRSLAQQAHPEIRISGTALQLVEGSGQPQADRLRIQAPNARGFAFAQGPIAAFDASRYRAARWHIHGLTAAQRLRLVWATRGEEQRPRDADIEQAGRDRGQLDLRQVPDWSGPISALGLAVIGPIDTPIEIQALVLVPHSPSLAEFWRQVVADLSPDAVWDGRSINFIYGGADQGPLSPVVLVALWVGLGMVVFGILRPPWRGHRALWPYGLLFVLGWLLLDLRWQWDLVQRLADTWASYAHLSEPERRGADDDRDLFPVLQSLMGALPSQPVRLFLVTEDAANSYMAQRARYHLQPHNVLVTAGQLPTPEQVRDGDYLLALVPPPRLRFVAATGRLSLARRALQARQLLAVPPVAALFQLADQPTGGER